MQVGLSFKVFTKELLGFKLSPCLEKSSSCVMTPICSLKSKILQFQSLVRTRLQISVTSFRQCVAMFYKFLFRFVQLTYFSSEAYSETSYTSKAERFAKIVTGF